MGWLRHPVGWHERQIPERRESSRMMKQDDRGWKFSDEKTGLRRKRRRNRMDDFSIIVMERANWLIVEFIWKVLYNRRKARLPRRKLRCLIVWIVMEKVIWQVWSSSGMILEMIPEKS